MLTQALPLENNHLLGKGLVQGTHVEQAWLEVQPVRNAKYYFSSKIETSGLYVGLKRLLGSGNIRRRYKTKVEYV